MGDTPSDPRPTSPTTDSSAPPTTDSSTTSVPSSTTTTTVPTTVGPAPRAITDAGIRVELPAGWEGEIYRRDPGEVRYDRSVPAARQLQPTSRSVVHLASFPLPATRGDYGSGAVEIMRDEDVLVVLFEYEPESATTAMFARDGLPRRLRPTDFDPNEMQRPLAGMAGCQRFFNVDEARAFCLFAVIGSYSDRAELTAKVNAALDGITIE
jgi:hypothetical protein